MMIESTELRVQRAEREARLWQRISNRLFEALMARGTPEEDKEKTVDAIEEYLNYTFPDDDE